MARCVFDIILVTRSIISLRALAFALIIDGLNLTHVYLITLSVFQAFWCKLVPMKEGSAVFRLISRKGTPDRLQFLELDRIHIQKF